MQRVASMKQNITLFVDGACRGNPGVGGWGAYIQFHDHEQKLCGGAEHTTNNRMELTAAIKGLQACPMDAEITIWTDSKYVQQGITQWIHGWKKKNWKDVKNPDLWQALDAVCQNRQISWQWIKGHAGHAGNEMADQLANLGTDRASGGKLQDHIETIAAKQAAINDTKKPEPDWLLDDPFGLGWQDDAVQPNDTLQADADPELDSDPDQTALHNEADITNPANQPQTQIDSTQFELHPDRAERAHLHPQIVVTDAHLQLQGTRQLILDTETTGFYYQDGDRVIEVGAIEMINRKLTGSSIHIYIKPDKTVGDSYRVHGISDEFLADKPTFEDIADVLFEFLKGAEIVAHNASFDMNFLNMEFQKAGFASLSSVCSVVDTLVLAKQKHPGQKNSLDALVKRYDIIARDRSFHGALLDAEILADVYLAMTGGQVTLDIDAQSDLDAQSNSSMGKLHADHLPIILPSATELAAHEAWMAQFEQKNAKKCLFEQ